MDNKEIIKDKNRKFLLKEEGLKVKRQWFVVCRGGIELFTMGDTKRESIRKYMERMDNTVWGKQKFSYWIKHRNAKCLKLKIFFEVCS